MEQPALNSVSVISAVLGCMLSVSNITYNVRCGMFKLTHFQSQSACISVKFLLVLFLQYTSFNVVTLLV